eukprot:UN09182
MKFCEKRQIFDDSSLESANSKLESSKICLFFRRTSCR